MNLKKVLAHLTFPLTLVLFSVLDGRGIEVSTHFFSFSVFIALMITIAFMMDEYEPKSRGEK
ncbi:MAG: hypothetical protein GOV00_00440 [Candidatus Altiarchaeota archaeon]|nr:hypothetical protein [Candidatus Altiarchaeota archaeon]